MHKNQFYVIINSYSYGDSMFSIKTILVEDDYPTRRLITKILESRNHAVNSFDNAEEALEYLHRNEFDFIILDRMLPGMDGLDICKYLRKNNQNKGITILIMTAKTSEDDQNEAINAGADEYIGKPFGVKVFETRLTILERMILYRKTYEKTLREKELHIQETEKKLKKAENTIKQIEKWFNRNRHKFKE